MKTPIMAANVTEMPIAADVTATTVFSFVSILGIF
jgi:hypothetical protein